MPDFSLSRRALLALGPALGLGLAGCALADAPGEPPELYGAWLAEDIDGGGVIDYAQTTLELSPQGPAVGSTGCNRYSGPVEIKGDRISFGMIVATQRGCVEALMNQEMKFLRALERAQTFRILAQERKLLLLDGQGRTLVRLASM